MASGPPPATTGTHGADTVQLLQVTFAPKDWHVDISFNAYLIALAVALVVIGVLWGVYRRGGFQSYDLDEVEMGTGIAKFTFKPNELDRQIAYQIWVELSTRKIGLDIDPDHDVVAEIYDSWFHFFSVTRDLIKTIPISKVNSKSTQKIIGVSIDVLNNGLRPHLTRWQARFRHWYLREIEKTEHIAESPQDIQKKFPHYDELVADLMDVNRRLQSYRIQMQRIVYRTKADLERPPTRGAASGSDGIAIVLADPDGQ